MAVQPTLGCRWWEQRQRSEGGERGAGSEGDGGDDVECGWAKR